MSSVSIEQKNRIHPHKFNLWVAIGSMMMMFAGLTSAYIVKRNQANWTSFEIPSLFWVSTLVIIASSVTMYLSLRAFRARNVRQHRSLFLITLILGVAFVVTQVFGFRQLWSEGFTLQKNVAFSFLYVIVGLHALHVIGGIVALIVMNIQSLSNKTRQYSPVPFEVMSTYWHFVDVLWLYLVVFLVMIK